MCIHNKEHFANETGWRLKPILLSDDQFCKKASTTSKLSWKNLDSNISSLALAAGFKLPIIIQRKF